MTYSKLLQFHIAPEKAAAIKEASARRGIKPSEWLRNAADLALAMDSAVDSVMDTPTSREDC